MVGQIAISTAHSLANDQKYMWSMHWVYWTIDYLSIIFAQSKNKTIGIVHKFIIEEFFSVCVIGARVTLTKHI